MRATVSTASGVIVRGPAGFLLRNRTQSASVFLETGSSNGAATLAKGFEWLVGDPISPCSRLRTTR
jgi:hypothetical protein